MKAHLLSIAAALAATAFSVSGVSAQERTVHVYNWSDYIDNAILEDFTKETGIKVVYDVFDFNEILETKLLAGGSGYDVVVPTAPFLPARSRPASSRSSTSPRSPTFPTMWEAISSALAKYDPGNEYAVNYMWGTTGIGYNVDKVKSALGETPARHWDVIFEPESAAKFKSCGIHVLDSADDTFPTALNYLGKDPDSKETQDLEAGDC